MEITKVVKDGKVIAANFHAPDGTVLKWKAKGDTTGLVTQKMSTCGRCLMVDNDAEGAEVERALTSMLGELGEKKVVGFLCDLDEKGTRLIDVLAAMKKGAQVEILELPRMRWPKGKEPPGGEAKKGGGDVEVLEVPGMNWSKEDKR